MRPLPILLLLATPAAALGPTQPWVSERGHVYHEVEAEAGAALQSNEVVVYHVGAAAQRLEGIETVTFLPDCIATSTLLGTGQWGQTDGEWGAIFMGEMVIFLDQSLPGPLHGRCLWQ